MLCRYSMLLALGPSLGKYAASSPRGHWFWTIFTSPRGLSSRAKIYAEVHPGETDNRHQVGMFPPRIRVPCRRRFHGSKMKEREKKKKIALRRARTSKKLRSQTMTKTFSASRLWFSSCFAREKRDVRKPRDSAVNNEFHLSFMRKDTWHISRGLTLK